jgi:carbon monoxide dehydrogenase subunit G
MQGSRTLAVTQQEAWQALNDPEMLKACIMGCERFEASDADTYTITVAIKIGPVAARFNGRIQLSDIVAPQSYTLGFDAQGGVAGFGKGQAAVQLLPTDGGCELRYTVHSTVGGKLAQLGQRLIDSAAKSLAEDFFRRFDEALQHRYPAPVTGTGAGGQDAGTVDTDAVAQPSGGLAGLPVWLWAALAVAVASGLIVATRG